MPIQRALRASLGLASSADSALEFLGVHYTYHRLPLADEEDWVADRVVRTDSDMMLQLNNRCEINFVIVHRPKAEARNALSEILSPDTGESVRTGAKSKEFPGYTYLAWMAWAWVAGREMETRGKPQRTPTPGFSGGSGVMGEIKNYAGYSRTDTGGHRIKHQWQWRDLGKSLDQLSLKPDLETVPVPGIPPSMKYGKPLRWPGGQSEVTNMRIGHNDTAVYTMSGSIYTAMAVVKTPHNPTSRSMLQLKTPPAVPLPPCIVAINEKEDPESNTKNSNTIIKFIWGQKSAMKAPKSPTSPPELQENVTV
ncbi:hypothetical protein K438DRAFT_1782391 [Mycena galopus ATCC 62051]|nr:hypothetical protein K438DRAFT_1782391 [Mycena galopus ATCC 62051]